MAGIKRSNSDNDDSVFGSKKRKVIQHHSLRHKQSWKVDPSLLNQNEFLFEAQLFHAITITLSAAGFDSVTPMALQSFKAHVEEYMSHFCARIRQSMTASRRTQPIPLDLSYALSKFNITPSSLLPQLRQPIPSSTTQLDIPAPPPDEPPPPSLEGMLGPDLSGATEKSDRRYIPKFFPDFPSKDTWHSTAVYTQRERDPRKIRERATEEGVEAEKALRQLMSAGKLRSGRRKIGANEEEGSVRRNNETEEMWEQTMAAILQEDEKAKRSANDMEIDFGSEGAALTKPKQVEAQDDGGGMLLVNYDRKYWRRAGRGDIPLG